MEEENSRSAASDDDDFEEDPNAEGAEDDEATLDEEEGLDDEADYEDELKQLEEEGDLSVEELRKRYGLAPDGGHAADEASSSSTNAEATAGTSQDAGSGSRGYFSDVEDEDENADEDYMPADPWKKEVRVDASLYQADIPEVDDSHESSCEASLLWSPSLNISPEALDAFLAEWRSLSGLGLCPSPLPDNEDALFALFSHKGEVPSTLKSFPFHPANRPRLTLRAESEPWTEKEEDLFEEGLRIYGKNFPTIQRSQLPHRLVGELVGHYYSWKRSDRHKAFVERRIRAAAEAKEVEEKEDQKQRTEGEWKNKQWTPSEQKTWSDEGDQWNGGPWSESAEALAHV